MSELIRKGEEVRSDFNNLSLENQKRVYSEIGKYVQVESVIGIFTTFYLIKIKGGVSYKFTTK